MPGRSVRCLALAIAANSAGAAARAGEPYGIGRAATPQEVAGWDIDVSPSGAGLPPGRGDARRGEAIFAEKCACCHGAHGEGKPMDRLVGGVGALRDRSRKNCRQLLALRDDAVRLCSPSHAFERAAVAHPRRSLSVSAYVLFLNGIVPQDTTLDASKLAKIEMPNRNGFVSANPPLGASPKP